MAQDRPIRVERRLAAILAADVAGYSRLMHRDEEITHTGFTIRRFRANPLSDNPTYLAWRERLYEAMRLAGVPEE
jgi:hypothetical protein